MADQNAARTPRADNAVNVLVLAAIAAVGVGYFAPHFAGMTSSGGRATAAVAAADGAGPKAAVPAGQASAGTAVARPEQVLPVTAWAVAAPGRVEPQGGEVRLSAIQGGRIVDVLVEVNDAVQAGDLLVRLDDVDHEARVAAADAEVNVRKRERDAENVTGLARDRRVAEDAHAVAERALTSARAEFDRLLKARKGASPPAAADVARQRDAVQAARERLEETRVALRRILSTANLPLQTRLESGLAAARADLSLAEAALERSRIRAPRDLTVLSIAAVVGETAVPSPEQPLLVMGDMSALRVRTEIEERDVAKVRVGQIVTVRSDAFPGQDFEGRVTSLASTLGPSKIGPKGPRRGIEVDVLEVFVTLNGKPPVLPGMRVDVLVKPEATAEATRPPAKSN
jgi:HlyD family secretion protein